jgi:transcriptional regulator with XRE-family HTH domain
MNYGKAIKIVRAAHGLTQSELAERLTIGASHLSLIESGKRQPSVKVLDEIATALEVPPHLLTVLASDPRDIAKRADPQQVAELARSLLELLVSSGEQPTLPMKAQTKTKRLKRAG